MSQELERVYTINLGKALLSVDTHRAPRAINMIKEFARHHMKTSDIKIEEDLAHQIWARGVRSPPRKIRVKMNKTDEGYVLVSPYTEEKESKEAPSKKELKEKSKKEKKDAAKVEKDAAKVEKDAAKVEKDAAKVEKDASKQVKKKVSKEVKKEVSKEVKKEVSKGVKKKSK